MCIHCLLTASMNIVEYVDGHWRPWSECAHAHVDLGLSCAHMVSWLFSDLEHYVGRRCAEMCTHSIVLFDHVFTSHWLSLRFYYLDHLSVLGSCKKFCHWVRITSVLRFIKRIFFTNLQSIPPLLKHIFVTFLPSREKQINSLLLVSVGDTDK